MYSLRLRLAQWVLAHRGFSFAFFIVVTAFFAAGLHKVELRTIFSDLLPTDDPFVQVYQDHPNFGSPLTMMVMIRRTDGDIFNTETLGKVWKFTRDIDLTPGVDHEQILSITTEKARYSEATPFGIDMRPLMSDRPPQTPEEVADFRTRVGKASNVRTFLISPDDKSTIIMATFIEQKVDYGVAFEYVQGLVNQARDGHHEVYLTGQPALIGWVYRHEWEMVGIFAVTMAILILTLTLYMRNLVGVLTPIITSAVAGIWAFGFVGWLNISIEPLLMVVPLLLTARSFSHSVQFTERFYEVYAQVGDRRKAAEITMSVMMAPSVLGILTDILGIIVVVAAPIPAMVRHAVFCGMWAVWLIPTGVVLISLLLATLPAPKNIHQLVGEGRENGVHRKFQAMLEKLASLSSGPKARWTTIVVVVLSALTIYTSSQIKIGNPVEGTNLLWYDSEFNTAVRKINANFPGVNTLEIVLEAKNQDSEDWVSQRADTVMTELKLQRLMEAGTAPPRATLSFADYLSEANRLFSGGDPRWSPLDPRDRAISAAAVGAMMGSSTKNFGHVVDGGLQNSTVSLWYADNKQETVDAALEAARKAVEQVGVDHKEFIVRLGTGTIALQEAVNRVIKRYQWVVIVAVDLLVFILCSLAYRSFVAGILLLIPVNLANEALIAAMHLLGVGLDVNSMIVAAIGVGVGIDYGIYLLSRICEELQGNGGDWQAAITASLRTTGKAIMFTAAIMTLGIVPWYAMSGLKFVADMGLLLMAIMAINMTLSLVVLPLLVWWVKPSFALRHNRWVGESVDLTKFSAH
ncbi:efflux RND transporter permease subunit [Stenotrophobium rhamnosiphilum]|uniref:RND transporter n=1 Tax=Stenotrophobium rhamnosiphilum TaxID=2029166 RepID=A0A2T5MEF5_9GAMM|nr:efflux RND transporter permease subunit [Stenotrophobium rhamnosiphilum]PTU30947.1 RND transporter [Stenotrophobium rhamnosiphilum]